MTAAGLAGWVVFAHVVVSDSFNKQVDIISEFGLIGAFDARSVVIRKEYEDRLDSAREQIDVMGFGLRALREDFKEKISDWLDHAPIRVLLIDPEYPHKRSSYAKQRDTEESLPDGTIKSDVELFVKELGPYMKDGRLKIRLYRCLPSINIFRIDDVLFWGPYLISQQSRNSPTLLVRRGGILFDRMNKHFDQIWQSDEFSRDPSDEWL